MVLKALIFNSFYFGQSVVVLKESDFYTVSIFGGCSVFERTESLIVSNLGGCSVLERTDF